jgi:hypothetical protein
MNTKQKMMALAALPLAGLLASGGVAAAQTAGSAPGTEVVQQAAARSGGTDPCPGQGMMSITRPCPAATAPQARDRDRDCGTCRGHHGLQGQAAVTAARTGHAGGRGDHGGR